ncbi:MAG TPA: O-antigen ligase family protein [Ornithinibacter sp.]|nr:O-antigen ligase family protein [Ornithinibacter sp.]
MTRRWPHTGALVVCFLAISAQVPWRPDVFYSGGVDPVVAAKGALTLTALGIGLAVVRSRGHRFDVPASPFLWVFSFLACTVLGAAADQRLVPTVVLAVRVMLVLLIVAVLMSTYRPQDVLHAVIVIFGLLVVVATLTTLVLGTTGRLRGGLPPLHANELASLAVMCLLWVVARLFRGEDRPASVLFVPACIAIIILTQSRTSLAAGGAALVVLVLFATRMRLMVACVVAAVPALVLGLVVTTSLTEQVVTRGEDAARLATFADRLFAWRAAVAPGQPFWHQWFGGGLSQKTVEVSGQPWTQQVLDSSWVSALVQAGWLGLAIGACWVVTILVGLFQAPRDWRGVMVALTVFLILRGFLESGLFDATTSFIVLCTLAFSSVLMRGHTTLDEDEPGLVSRAVSSAVGRADTASADAPAAAPVAPAADDSRLPEPSRS